MEEIWKDIYGYTGIYQVSNLGRVRTLRKRKNQKVLSLIISKQGYCMVDLTKHREVKRIFVHRLVAKAFIPNPYSKPFVNHKDGNKQNNYVDNLEWVTAKENNIHAIKTGLNDVGVRIAVLKNGKEIKRFNSLAEAGRYYNVGRNTIFSRIHNCKHMKKNTKKYEWVVLEKPPYQPKII